MRPRISSAVALTLASYAGPVPEEQRGRILDATAFEGSALRTLGKLWNCDAYGTEPTQAWLTAVYETTRIVQGDLDAVRMTPQSMSAVMGVLPHTPQDLGSREHTAFVHDLLEAVAPHGLVAVLGPAPAFDKGLCTALLRRLDPAQAFALPDAPDEVIVVGMATDGPRAGGTPGRFSSRIAAGSLPPFEPAAEPWCPLPVADAEDFFFGPRFVSYGELAKIARETGVWFAPAFAEELLAPEDRTIRPVMPLRRGHLALLIAAGMFDTLVLERNGHPIALKGHTYKEPITTEDDATKRVRDRFRTSVATLDLRTGDLQILQGA